MITKALIAWGGWEGHGPEGCAVVVAEILKARGVQCTVGQGTSAFVQHDLSDFQVIVPVFTMTDIEDHEVDAVCRAVRGGVGLAGFHGGMGDSFRTSIAWQHMVGGQFVGHPRDFRDYRVDIRQPDHGICRGLGSFDLHSEQYYMQTDPRINVLATTTFHETGLSECDGVTRGRFG